MNKKISENDVCFTCGVKENLHRHHLDWNHKNNNSSNIEILCEHCHMTIHKECGYLSHAELIDVRLMVQEKDPGRFTEIIDKDSWISLGDQPDLFEE